MSRPPTRDGGNHPTAAPPHLSVPARQGTDRRPTAGAGVSSQPVEDRRVQMLAELDRELQRIVDSGEYARWFTAMSRFHRYSPTNAMWIAAQAPDATRVASYRTWQQLGRQVRKGESGIMVAHPKAYWVDPTTGQRTAPPRTDLDRARLQRKVGFGVGHVFDVSQTDGDPLPELGQPAPTAAPEALVEHLEAWCADQGVTVATAQLPDGLSGYYQRHDDRIVLAATNSPGERAATLAHELAHRHDPELIRAHQRGDTSYYRHNRADCEAVAEGAAHVISGRYGLDLAGHAAGYIASWVDGDTDRFKQLHQRVGEVTRAILPPDRLDLILTAAASQSAKQAPPQRAGRR